MHTVFELLKVVDVSGHVVNWSFEILNFSFVRWNLRTGFLDQLGHLFLARAQVVDQVAQISIDFIESFQALVHLVGVALELVNFHLSGGDIAFELFDFVVEHEFELF